MNKTCGSFLFWHRSDARGALQQSPILQNDIDKLTEMNYNSKCKLGLHRLLCSELLRPFTQLNEQTLKIPVAVLFIVEIFTFTVVNCFMEMELNALYR